VTETGNPGRGAVRGASVVIRNAGYFVLLAAALLTGFQALFPIGRGPLDGLLVWYQLSGHSLAVGHSIVSVFTGTVLVLTAIAMVLALLATAVRRRVADAQTGSYLDLLIAMGAAAAFLTFLAATVFAGLRPAWSLAALAGVGWLAWFCLAGGAARRNSEARLFSFYEFWTQRIYLPGEVQPTQSFTDFLKRPGDPVARSLMALLPWLFTLACLGSAALLIMFGWGILARILNAIDFMRKQEWSSSISLFEMIQAWRISLSLIVLPVTLVVLVQAQTICRRMLATNRPKLIKIAAHGIVAAGLLGVLCLAFYTLFAAEPERTALAQGPGYTLPLIIIGVLLALLAVYRCERITMAYINGLHSLRTRRFWIDTNQIYSSFPQPKEATKGYVFLHTQSDTYSVASLLLILCRLKQLGWQVAVMDQWPLKEDFTGQKHIDQFMNISIGTQRALNFDWIIDWPNRRVEAAGMNFYHPIWEGLSRHFGRYSITMEPNSETEKVFRDLLQVADAPQFHRRKGAPGAHHRQLSPVRAECHHKHLLPRDRPRTGYAFLLGPARLSDLLR
jgi:hypothetical protein